MEWNELKREWSDVPGLDPQPHPDIAQFKHDTRTQDAFQLSPSTGGSIIAGSYIMIVLQLRGVPSQHRIHCIAVIAPHILQVQYSTVKMVSSCEVFVPLVCQIFRTIGARANACECVSSSRGKWFGHPSPSLKMMYEVFNLEQPLEKHE